MATNYGIEVLIDTDDADERTEIIDAISIALRGYTRTTSRTAAYSAGSTSSNMTTITAVGTGTVNMAVRVTFDTAVMGVDETAEIERKILRALGPYATTVAHTGTYTAGDRAYDVTIALS